jgi:hypothetical protein
LIEPRSTGSHEHAVRFSEEHAPLERYVIVGHGSKGLELPPICCWDSSGEEVLPVFSSEQAAREFLSCLSSSLGKGWYVRGFSGGELVSMLYAFHRRIKGVLLDPPPGAIWEEVRGSLVRWDALVSSLLETSSYHRRALGGSRSS